MNNECVVFVYKVIKPLDCRQPLVIPFTCKADFYRAKYAKPAADEDKVRGSIEKGDLAESCPLVVALITKRLTADMNDFSVLKSRQARIDFIHARVISTRKEASDVVLEKFEAKGDLYLREFTPSKNGRRQPTTIFFDDAEEDTAAPSLEQFEEETILDEILPRLKLSRQRLRSVIPLPEDDSMTDAQSVVQKNTVRQSNESHHRASRFWPFTDKQTNETQSSSTGLNQLMENKKKESVDFHRVLPLFRRKHTDKQ